MREFLFTALLCCSALASDYQKPERQVQGNVLTSQGDPKIRIKLPSSVQYVGADRRPLYDIADCELHVFVDATSQKKVEHLYWVQFEAYLSSRPELHYTYPFTRTDTLSGLLFDVRKAFPLTICYPEENTRESGPVWNQDSSGEPNEPSRSLPNEAAGFTSQRLALFCGSLVVQ